MKRVLPYLLFSVLFFAGRHDVSAQTTSACSFAQPNLYVAYWDSCSNTNKAIYGYASFNSCFKYQWRVNGNIVSTTRMLTYPVTQNGTYQVCLTVIDSCRNCDTTICTARTFNCVPAAPPCSFAQPNLYTSFSDSCTNTTKALFGYASFNSCFKYQWKVNGVVVGTTRMLTYPVTQNGTYQLCLTVIDSCRNCDTTICSTRVLNCSPTPPPCNWNTPNIYVAFWDSCSNTNKSINGYAILNSCFKYQWKVNGVVVGTTRTLNYPVTQNGTYVVCLSVNDTCKHCDTTFCSTRVFTCIPVNTPCSFAQPNLYTSFSDSCTNTTKALYGYATFNSCFKYQWKVNGVVVGTTRILNYPVPQNGTYQVCLIVTDTCKHCDTTICSTRILNCVPTSTPCNWNTPNQYVTFWDSCTVGRRSLNGYAFFNPCYKYKWKVNGVVVGTTRILNYPVPQNGTYVVCLTMIDTCRNCDTTICSTRVINCTSPPPCNWAPVTQYVSFWDSCTNTSKSLNGYAYFNSCYKYQWKVNGVVVGTTRTLHYNVPQNGTYVVCLTLIDTCRRCDTTICSTRVINCTPTVPPCKWTPTSQYVLFWDSCSNTNRSISGYALYNSCFKYQWKVNGVVVGTTRILNYPVTQNGTYVVCLTLIDTCKRCDTTICSTRVINCVPGPNNCHWTSPVQYVSFWDSCSHTNKSLNGYAYYNSCFKYQWKVNGVVVGTTRMLNYPVTQYGTYVVCLTLIDTCKRCDTTICSTRVINCPVTSPSCWSGRNVYPYFWDTCTATKKSLNAYISPNSTGYACLKYTWKVNGVVVGTGPRLNYPVTQNGSYLVCVTVKDTCRNCDTTICSERVLNCSPTIAACSWNTQHPYVRFWDSCATNHNSVNGYIAFNSNTVSCFKYQWRVNGQLAGTDRWLNYPITENGTYKICVSVIDTCRHCDTSFCSIRQITCVNELVTIEQESQLMLFENPTTGLINIDWTGERSTYILANSSGQVMQSGNLLNGTQLLDLSAYSSGLYILKVQSSEGLLTRKISLQKQ